MKIGLLSFHNAANYGAALQSFALQQALVENGFDCEYINYQNRHRKNAYSMSHHILSSIKKGNFREVLKFIMGFPFLTLRKVKFKSFYSKKLKFTKEIYSSSEEAGQLNNIYSKFIVGSDQVWNPNHNGSDNAYLLSFVNDDSKKISYSSSFGIVEIPEDLKRDYKIYLSQIQHLSVREQSGVALVKNLINRDATLVLDPVFLLSRDQWLQIADQKIHLEPYIFSYTNKPNQLEYFLHTTSFNIENNLLYKLSRNLTISDFILSKIKVKYSMSPTEFLSVIRDASLIVSASFHCVVLSIIMNKQFVAILKGDKGKDERLLNILSLLGLEKRIFNDLMTLDQVEKPIDYDLVNKKIEILRSSSMDFLLNALHN